MDRRAVLGMSKAELTMVRVGHVVGLLCTLVLLPLLPFLFAFVLGVKLAGLFRGSPPDRGREDAPDYGSGA